MSLAIPLYMLASSSMLVLNKAAITQFPRPMLLLYIQLTFTTLAVTAAGDLSLINISPWSTNVLKKFWLVPLTFLLGIFCNIKILEHTNVETFIALRASTPIILSVLDAKYLNRHMPSNRSWISIVGVLASVFAYVHFEGASLQTDSYFWLVAWYLVFLFDQVYVKHVVDTVSMTTWDRVWYTNATPLIVLFPLILVFEDSIELDADKVTDQLHPIIASCVVGVLMSATSYWLRSEVSATTFTVTGNVCKFLTIIINFLVWDKHASRHGLIAIMSCVGFASIYKQAPFQDPKLHKLNVV